MIKKILGNAKGVGIFELIVSIAVGSIILLTLTSMLTMVMTTNAKMKIEQRMENESYLISEKIKHNLTNLLKIEFSDVTGDIGDGVDDITIIRVDYCERYDGNIENCSTDYDANNLTTPPTPEPYFIKLSYHDEDGERLPQLTFEIGESGSVVERLHDNNIRLLEGTELSLSDGSLNLPPYVWVLTLTINVQIEIHNEDNTISTLDPQIFETEIVFSRD